MTGGPDHREWVQQISWYRICSNDAAQVRDCISVDSANLIYKKTILRLLRRYHFFYCKFGTSWYLGTTRYHEVPKFYTKILISHSTSSRTIELIIYKMQSSELLIAAANKTNLSNPFKLWVFTQLGGSSDSIDPVYRTSCRGLLIDRVQWFRTQNIQLLSSLIRIQNHAHF